MCHNKKRKVETYKVTTNHIFALSSTSQEGEHGSELDKTIHDGKVTLHTKPSISVNIGQNGKCTFALTLYFILVTHLFFLASPQIGWASKHQVLHN